jgi:putative ABC transport system ATP-binding protein
MLRCEDVSHSFGKRETPEQVLDKVSFSCERGEACALIGPSGSGKTTLLCILGCLLRPTNGDVFLEDSRVEHRIPRVLTEIRRQHIGFVFQHAQLIPFLNADQNCRIVGRNAGLDPSEVDGRLDALFERLGIARVRSKKPDELSGGERQRVAIARALVHQPAVVLADEPTAALDWNNGRAVVELLIERAKEQKAVLITVTHDPRLVPYFDRVLHIDSGKLSEA